MSIFDERLFRHSSGLKFAAKIMHLRACDSVRVIRVDCAVSTNLPEASKPLIYRAIM